MAMSGRFGTNAQYNRTIDFSWNAVRNGRSATINWNVLGGGSRTGWVNCGPVNAWANGSHLVAFTGRQQTYQGTSFGSGSFGVGYDAAGNASFVAAVSAAIFSVDENAWSGDITQWLDNIGPAAPVYNSTSHSNVTSNSVRLTASINTQGVGITGGGWDVGESQSNFKYYDGGPTDKTITGLKPNTTYYYRGYVTTSGGATTSGWQSFKTSKPPAPTITGMKLNSRTNAGFLVDATITPGSGASISEVLMSANGGESWHRPDSNDSPFGWTTGLNSKTKYVFKLKVTDNFGTVTTSDPFEVITLPNEPMLQNCDITQKVDSILVEYSGATADGNELIQATIKDVSFKLTGSGNDYDSGWISKGSDTSGSHEFNKLTPNSKYILWVKVTDSFNQSFSYSENTSTLAGTFIKVITSAGVKDGDLIIIKTEGKYNITKDKFKVIK